MTSPKSSSTKLPAAVPRTPAKAEFGRRTMLRGLSFLAVIAAADRAFAQASWLPDSFKTGAAQSSTTPRAERKPEALNDLRPNAIPYRSEAMVEALENVIARYEKLVQTGGWPQIPGTRMIRPEDDDERIPTLRRRLEMSGELKKTASQGGWGSSSFGFDDELDKAVRQFQENHGLRVTGRVDKSTLQALNVPPQARLAQLRLNLQRIKDLVALRNDDRYILVNAAAFQLEAVEKGEVQQRHRVIAGKPGRDTPIVRATIKAMNFFPYWRVPDSVATLDLIPKLQKDPEYLQREKIRVLTGNFNGAEVDAANIDWKTASATQLKFRQDPGNQNALGLLRIDMPNSEGVYMHDTPMKPLFQQRSRAFSAGCVRVQDVFKLGEWIARYEQGWDQPGRAEQVVEGGQPLDLNLTRPIPVYFTYITAWAEPGGLVQFRPDVYGRDGHTTLTAGRDRDETEGPAPAQGLAP
ncbi:MAG: L,D-transpeptidase family protein [Hyphomicrobiaceae bacterium]|nr:L,D-transpeptidase family protein [Hyphomicrobiaceae bacterium]